MNPYRFSQAFFSKKLTFFRNFGMFGISSMSQLEKWSYFFNLMNFVVSPFSAQARQLKLENPMGKFEKTHIYANFCTFRTIFIHFETTSDFSNKIISIQGTVRSPRTGTAAGYMGRSCVSWGFKISKIIGWELLLMLQLRFSERLRALA